MPKPTPSQVAQKRKALAVLGENLSADFLTKQDYVILARNFYSKYGEIDIIATKGDTLYFFEVKTRRTDSINNPAETITYQKTQRLIRTALTFLDKNPAYETKTKSWRISLIGILLEGGKPAKIDIIPIN